MGGKVGDRPESWIIWNKLLDGESLKAPADSTTSSPKEALPDSPALVPFGVTQDQLQITPLEPSVTAGPTKELFSERNPNPADLFILDWFSKEYDLPIWFVDSAISSLKD